MSRAKHAAEPQKKKSGARRIGSTVLSVLVVVMLLAVGYLTYCSVSGKIAYFGNHAILKILTPSMEPTIPTDEYILVEKVDTSVLAPGDVIVFVSRDTRSGIYGKMNTHRIVQIRTGADGAEYITRGDNNPANDAMATKEADVVGRYVKNLDDVTSVARFFSKKWVFFGCVVIPAALLLLLCIWDIVKKSREVRMELMVEEELKRLHASANAKDSLQQSEPNEPREGNQPNETGITGESAEPEASEPSGESGEADKTDEDF